MENIKVKFTQTVSGIEAGTVRSLPVSTANECIALGVAELVKEKAKK